MPLPPRLALLLVALLAAVAVGPGAAAADGDEGRVIQLAIQADADMNDYEVRNKFTSATASAIGFNFGAISVDPIDPASFLLLSSIVRRGILEAAPAGDDPRGVLVEPLRGQDGSWCIDLRDPDKFLETLKVTVIDAETRKERVEELQPAPRTETARPLRYHSPGTYILKLPRGLHPRGAVLTVSTEGTGDAATRKEDIGIGWPDVGRCYLVTLKNVTGDERRLFDSLKDPKKVGNPIKEIYPSKAELIVGRFGDKPVVIWRVNAVLQSFLRPVNAEPKRLWLRFPLTQSEEAAVVAELDAQLAPADGFKKLPAWLAARRLPDGAQLKPGMDAWVELPVDPARERAELWVPILTREWKKLLAEDPTKVGDRAILVWEFENPSNPADREVIKVEGKRYQREQLATWRNGLPGAPTE